MKYVISLFWCSCVLGSPIHVFHEEELERANSVKDIFVNEYQIPEDLIGLKVTSDCETLRGKGKLDVCINKNGDLLVVSVDKSFVNESLKIFTAP